ncbi:MAG: aminotransferase class I/II-fold pyridoxal phosphate-dependent enzyme [Gammaproteobacteria bacterium]
MQDIRLLIPEMPDHVTLKPWLERIDSNHYYTNFGPLVKQFEAQLTDLLTQYSVDSKQLYVTTCHSGTAGLELAIRALELPPGSHILVPAYTFVASALAIIHAGHVPVFADIDAINWQLTPDIAARYLQQYTIDAVMPVAAYGFPCEARNWQIFAECYELPVIIDAAGAIGNQWHIDKVVTVYSLHATKLFGVGEGGLVVATNPHYIRKIELLAGFGLEQQRLTALGSNYKLSEYHAAVGLATFDIWGQKTAQNNAIRNIYAQQLTEIESVSVLPNFEHLLSNLLPIRLNNAVNIENLMLFLQQHAIETRRVYYPTLDQQPALMQYADPHIPPIVSHQLAQQILCLPLHYQLNAHDIERIVELIKYYLA